MFPQQILDGPQAILLMRMKSNLVEIFVWVWKNASVTFHLDEQIAYLPVFRNKSVSLNRTEHFL
jgi:hypothetical protein